MTASAATAADAFYSQPVLPTNLPQQRSTDCMSSSYRLYARPVIQLALSNIGGIILSVFEWTAVCV